MRCADPAPRSRSFAPLAPLPRLRIIRPMPERKVQSYQVLVGMEIHVQLATKPAKCLARRANGFGGEPNSQVDPVVLGLPGVLPVMNKKAVEYLHQNGTGPGVHHRQAHQVGSQELLLPRPAQELSDQPVRFAAVRASGEFELALKDGDFAEGAHSPRASGRRCGQADARCAGRVSHRLVHRRPEPRRHAAAGDRHRARSAAAAKRWRLWPGAAEAGAVPGREPRADADGAHAV